MSQEIHKTPQALESVFNHAMQLHRAGRIEEALPYYDRAHLVSPDNAHVCNNRGIALTQLGRLPDAVLSFREALALDPAHADAHANLGHALAQLGRHDEAVRSYSQAVTLVQGHAAAQYGLASALAALGRLKDALEVVDQLLTGHPGHAPALYLRGEMLLGLERWEEAVRAFESVTALVPELAEAHSARGVALERLGRPGEALSSHGRAATLQPDNALFHFNLGTASHAAGEPEKAIEHFRRALTLRADYPEAIRNLANALQDMGRFDDAMALHDRLLAMDPDNADDRWNKSLLLLLTGNLAAGFTAYEARKHKTFEPLANREYVAPIWTGSEDVGGKTIFVYSEQGLGDIIQFSRYLRKLTDLGATVICSVPDRLYRLLSYSIASVQFVREAEIVERFDFHVPLMSLPRAFATDLHSVPAQVPYLAPEPRRIEQWRQRIGTDGFRIGVAWHGDAGNMGGLDRSFPLGHFQQIARLPNVRLISLQKGPGTEQIGECPTIVVETLGEDFDAGPDGFVDCAAAMACLDLVITLDTSIAHLAGALGRPTWIVLKHVPDWRWMLDRTDSPWYPTVRLFRQYRRNDWTGPFDDMRNALRALLASPGVS